MHPAASSTAAVAAAFCFSRSPASYCSVDSVSSWSCPVCGQGSLTNFKLTHKFFDAHTNTFGYAGLAPAAGENVIVFSFRGATPSPGRNWITDLNASRRPYPGLRGAAVHKGFYNAYLTVARQVNLAAKSLLAQCRNCHIYITGHSLGGAIATFAAADLYSLSKDLTLYTFGSPRVGDDGFARYFDSIVPDTFRVVNNEDLVPHLPQRFLGFRHVSQEVWYHSSAKSAPYKLCAGGEDDSCANSIALQVDENSIRDHASYLGQPMGCRVSDLQRMGLVMLEQAESTTTSASAPMQKLRAAASAESDEAVDAPTLVEMESRADLEAEAEAESTDAGVVYNAEDILEAEADAKAQTFKLAGNKNVAPARILDPLTRPGIAAMNEVFQKVQSQWAKMPISFNPTLKEETEEDKWNRMYPEPKDDE